MFSEEIEKKNHLHSCAGILQLYSGYESTGMSPNTYESCFAGFMGIRITRYTLYSVLFFADQMEKL